MNITPEDYMAISNLIARYCNALNVHDVDGWISLFTEDANYHVYGRTWIGHDGLRSMVSATRIALHLGGHPAITMVDGDNARSTRCMFVHFPSDDSTRNAVYEDQIRRTADGWRFFSVVCQFITSDGLKDRPPKPRT